MNACKVLIFLLFIGREFNTELVQLTVVLANLFVS